MELLLAILLVVVYHLYSKHKKREAKRYFESKNVNNPENQLRFVSEADFYKKKLMNREEYRVFFTIKEFLLKERNRYSVHPQVNLGEFIGTKHSEAFRSINSKRVDMLVIDKNGIPVVAVEYHGAGRWKHDEYSSAARDIVKKQTFRRAGICYLEVEPGDTGDDIRQRMRTILPVASSG